MKGHGRGAAKAKQRIREGSDWASGGEEKRRNLSVTGTGESCRRAAEQMVGKGHFHLSSPFLG